LQDINSNKTLLWIHGKTLEGYDGRLYFKLMLNRLKIIWGKLSLFIHVMGPSSKKIFQNIISRVFLTN
jgi:hypothetical protein